MVTPRYFPFMGGVETHVHEVGRRLVKNNIQITLLTTMPSAHTPALPLHDSIEGMRIIRVPAWPPQRDYYIAPNMYSLIARGGWDLIHCQGCHTFVPPLAMLAAKKAQIPYVVTFHTGGHSSPLRTRIRNAQWKLQRPLLVTASKLIGVSNFEADYFRSLLDLPPKQFTVIPNGAAISSMAPLPRETSNQTLIVSFGRLEKYKGHQRLITALPKIREKCPDAHLLIIGTGPYEATLRQLAARVGVKEYVEIRSIPASDRQTMAQTLSRAAVVALLSEYEAHPIAVMEALALRRPVLVADTSGLRELAEQKFARAIPLNSTSDEIAMATLRQINEPLVPEPFELPTWEDCTQKLLTVYEASVRNK